MRKNRKRILVFGCTGTVGKYVLRQLTRENCEVKGVLRNFKRQPPMPPENASNLSYTVADLEDPLAAEAACNQIDTLFLLTATHPNQVAYETNVIRAAKKKGVTRIVKLSAPDVQPTELVEVSKWHRQIEAVLEQSGIEYCCIRPYAFMQNWERNNFTIRKFNKFYSAMQAAPRNYVDARDVAEIAVRFLLMEAPITHKIVTVTGPEAIDHYDMAERLSSATGRSIAYVEMTGDKLKRMLIRRAKLPKWLANHLVELDELAVKIPEPTQATVEIFLSKKPRTMDAYLRESKALFRKMSIWDFFRK